MNNITWESLATVAGAGIGAGVIVQFIKIFTRDKIGDAGYRMMAAAAGLVVVMGVVAVNGVWTWPVGILGAFTGLQAGLSASQTYESVRHGLDHEAIKK